MKNKVKKELKEMTIKDLAMRAYEYKKELFLLRMKKFSSSEKNTALAKNLRKSLACTLTLLKQRALHGAK